MSERKLATIRQIAEVAAIPNADKICAYRVDGWWVVDQVGRYNVGDMVLYLEVDSWVPHTMAPFLSKGLAPKVYNNVEGNRLRTIKLRGQVSQGLLLPTDIVETVTGSPWLKFAEGVDLAYHLGIQKWEAPIPAQLAGKMKGNFPSFIPKTDQERIQNIYDKVMEKFSRKDFKVSIKLDGSSCTVYYKDGDVGVCSRNLELIISEENKDNSFIKTATESKLAICLAKFGLNIAIQGELMGPGVQGNREGLGCHTLFIFDIYDIDSQSFYTTRAVELFYEKLRYEGLDTTLCRLVPSLGTFRPLDSLPKMLIAADGPSLHAQVREGVVWRCIEDPNFSFKVISNQYLLAEKD